MATWKFKGLDEYLVTLERLTNTREYIGRTIYTGADIVADAVKAEINALPVENRFANDGEKLRGITNVQKAGLRDGFGIAKMRKDGDYYNVKLGFDGYNGQKTAAHPNGQPNSMIARSVVSGTSFRQKNDFISRATSRTKKQAEQVMKEELDKEIKRITQ